MAMTRSASPVTVGAFEAKTHFSKLLERAHDGEEIVITHRGEPYARLVPLQRAEQERDARIEALARIRAYAKANPINATIDELIEWKNEGRR